MSSDNKFTSYPQGWKEYKKDTPIEDVAQAVRKNIDNDIRREYEGNTNEADKIQNKIKFLNMITCDDMGTSEEAYSEGSLFVVANKKLIVSKIENIMQKVAENEKEIETLIAEVLKLATHGHQSDWHP